MPAQYPTAVYTPRTIVNRAGVSFDSAKTKVIFAEDKNNSDAEIVAIQNELGLSAKGAYATVKAWLTAITDAINAIVLPTKTTGAGINTGTNDTNFATPKAIADSDIAFLSDIPTLPVKATGVEINTGTDDAKFATPKALADAGVNTRLKTKIITGTRNLTAATGDVAYTGVGFQPSSIVAFFVLDGGTSQIIGIGSSDSSKTSVSVDRAGSTGTGNYGSYLIQAETTQNSAYQIAAVKSYDADGFTLTWTKGGAPTGTAVIRFLCSR